MKHSARDVARLVLRRVEQGEAYATLTLGAALARAPHLGPADRGLCTELVYGVLRHRTRLDRALANLAPRGLGKLPAPALIALRVAAYQLLLLRVPAHAAVDDAVRAIKPLDVRLGSFANALLRRLAREGEPPPPADLRQRLELFHSLPGWLVDALASGLTSAVGVPPADAELEEAAEAMNRSAPVCLRVALGRTTRAALAARLAAERPDAAIEAPDFPPEALLVRGGGGVETLAPFQEGLCTVQDLGAQLVGRLVEPRSGERILDACAGVGGKALHLAELARGVAGEVGAGGLLIDAADLSPRKADLAVDAARRLGLPGIRTVTCDLTRADAPLAPSYDRVLLDAPCSGLGVLRRHPEAKWRRAPADVAELAALQARLLDALAPRVRPAGGVLVYSVCTFTRAEGEEQTRRFLGAHPDFVVWPPEDPGFAPFLDAAGHFHTWPHRHQADAFYAVRLRRS